MIHAELHLEAVNGLGLRDPHHAGVIDQQVNTLMRGHDLLGRGTYRRLRSEVQRYELQGGIRHAGADLVDRGRRLLLVAYRHHDVRALRRQLPCGLQPQPAVGPGHDGDPALLAGDVCCAPGHDGSLSECSFGHHDGIMVPRQPGRASHSGERETYRYRLAMAIKVSGSPPRRCSSSRRPTVDSSKTSICADIVTRSHSSSAPRARTRSTRTVFASLPTGRRAPSASSSQGQRTIISTRRAISALWTRVAVMLFVM